MTSGRPSGPPPSSPQRPPSGPTTPAPATPPRSATANPNKTKPLVLGAALVIVALLAGAFVVTNRDDTIEYLATGNEVFLEPAQSIGTDPFFADTADLVAIKPVLLAASSEPEGITASRTNDGQTLIEADKTPSINIANGTEPGLYGGTQDNARCNRQQLVEFLEANPDKAEAWARVQGIGTNRIREFVDTLTPVVLLKDTRVTNHGFKNGVANPIQSTLQAGTAVLVDKTGMPRVRCACGNPLSKPIPQSTVRYLGPAWDSFDPDSAQTIEPGPATDVFILQNVDGGIPFDRPTGTTGNADYTIPAEELNLISDDIYIQVLLENPDGAQQVGGEITDGVIIRSDSAANFGGENDETTRPGPSPTSVPPTPSPTESPTTIPATPIPNDSPQQFRGTVTYDAPADITIETSNAELEAEDFLSGVLTFTASWTFEGTRLCSLYIVDLSDLNVRQISPGVYAGTGAGSTTQNGWHEDCANSERTSFDVRIEATITGTTLRGFVTSMDGNGSVTFEATLQ